MNEIDSRCPSLSSIALVSVMGAIKPDTKLVRYYGPNVADDREVGSVLEGDASLQLQLPGAIGLIGYSTESSGIEVGGNATKVDGVVDVES